MIARLDDPKKDTVGDTIRDRVTPVDWVMKVPMESRTEMDRL